MEEVEKEEEGVKGGERRESREGKGGVEGGKRRIKEWREENE